jgi:hypothetical protein
VTIRAAVDDPNGRTVELTDERWDHIVERHPEIQTLHETVLQAVEAPDRHMPGRLVNEEWYYVETDTPSNWLKARRLTRVASWLGHRRGVAGSVGARRVTKSSRNREARVTRSG